MPTLHNAARWHQLPLNQQLANIGSEVSRISSWRARGDEARQQQAAVRAFELLALTIADARWRGRRRELTRLREVSLDVCFGSGEYGASLDELQAYFLSFALAARRSP